MIQEIWRPFLVVMLMAMLAEAALCLPRRKAPDTLVKKEAATAA